MLKEQSLLDNLIPFQAVRVNGTKTVWKSPLVDDIDTASFASQFSYVIPTSRYFEHLEFDYQDTKKLYAERYGGSGLGKNGGGVRCGNDDPFQIKGIGKNILAGENVNLQHSYGGLGLGEAVKEAIYTNILSDILPIGTIPVIGIIYLGEKTAMSRDNQRGKGALLVREKCIRPAHYLPCNDFVPEEKRERLMSDEWRVRRAQQSLCRTLGGDNNYIVYLGQFLSNCANQFAFSHFAGIVHSSLTPSNISLSGRWLDLPRAGFDNGFLNRERRISYYQEPNKAIEIASDLAYNYSKYNNCTLNISPLVDYYYDQLKAYKQVHLEYVIGIPYKNVQSKRARDCWLALTVFIEKVIWSGKKKDNSKEQKETPLLSVLEFTYLSQLGRRDCSTLLNVAKNITSDDLHTAIECYSVIIEELENDQNTKADVIRLSMIRLVKRYSMCLCFSFKESLYAQFLIEVDYMSFDDIANYIDSFGKAAKWIFESNCERKITVIRTSTLTVEFDQYRKKYLIVKNGTTSVLSSFSDVYWKFLAINRESNNLSEFNYSFLEAVDRLNGMLQAVESSDCKES